MFFAIYILHWVKNITFKSSYTWFKIDISSSPLHEKNILNFHFDYLHPSHIIFTYFPPLPQIFRFSVDRRIRGRFIWEWLSWICILLEHTNPEVEKREIGQLSRRTHFLVILELSIWIPVATEEMWFSHINSSFARWPH